MDAQANTTVSVLTASSIDEYSGARTETTTATGITAAVAEQTRTVRDPVTGNPRTVRHILIRLPAGTAVTNDDRLRDDTDNTVYAVRQVRQHKLAGRVGDLIAEVARLDDTQP